MLLPVFAAAREKSRQSQCASNIQQLCAALLLYADDNDGSIMLQPDNHAGETCSGCDRNPAHFRAWYDWILPYTKASALSRCADYAGPFPIPDGWGVQGRFMSATYALSGKVMWNLHGYPDRAPDPAGLIMLAESPGGTSWFDTYGSGWTCPDILMWNGQIHDERRVAGTDDWGDPAAQARVTVAATDGHARSIVMSNWHGGSDSWGALTCWNPAWGPYVSP